MLKVVNSDLQSCHSGATVAGHIFQRKVDSIFLHLENVMIIADDIMVIGYQEDE